MRTFTVLLILSLLVGCNLPRTNHKLVGIERLFMHSEGSYSVLVREDSRLVQLGIVVENSDSRAIQLVDDVPKGSPLWVEYSCQFCGDLSHPLESQTLRVKGITFHISSVADINGAGWDRGKFGHGQTVVIQ